MSGSSDEILHALSQHSEPDTPRQTINLLFAHCDTLQTDRILSQLRGSRYAPRGQSFDSLNELQRVLGKRSWDILVMSWKPNQTATLSPESVMERLHHLDRDLPVILLLPGEQYPDPTHWFASGVHALVPEANTELLLLSIERSFQALGTRRDLLDARVQLKRMNERCEHLIEVSSLAICFIHNGLIQHANRSFANLFGYDDANRLREHSLRQMLQADNRDDLDRVLHESARSNTRIHHTLCVERPDKTRFDALFTIFPDVSHGRNGLSIEVVTNLDNAKEIFSDIHPASGFSNQQAFFEALETTCHNAHRGGQDRSLLLLTLDHLDVIRSEVGTEGVELILRDIAGVLKQQVGPAHRVGHLDDDRFTILMHNADPDQAMALGDRLCHTISNHVCQVKQTSIHTTVSIGVVMINDSAPSPQEVLQRAQQAAESLHHGNRPGNGVNLYQNENHLQTGTNIRMGKRLLNALKLGRFRLLFQPVVPLRLESQNQYYEVLMRLISDSEKALSPSAFVAQSIDPEVLIELDRWVISAALEKLSEAFLNGQKVYLLINLSGASLGCSELLGWLSETLKTSAVPAEYLVFQISESDAAVNLIEAHAFTKALRQLNCQICLKHFGSSPNSKRVLRELDTEYIKLDGSYIQDLEKRALSLKALQEMLVPLQHQHKLIIAPLVESTRVISDLYAAEIDLIQGYYLQQPREQMDYDFFGAGQP